MATVNKSITDFSLDTANTSPGNNLLAAPGSSITRYLRGIVVHNNGATSSFSFGYGTAAALAAGTNAQWFQKPIAAGETFAYYWPGRGHRLASTDLLLGAAGVANVSCDITYTEDDLT